MDGIQIEVHPKFAVTVIAVAGGYPEKYAKGDAIHLSQPPTDAIIFHAGTTLSSGTLRTDGGRVMAVTSTGVTLSDAIITAYEGMRTVTFDKMHYRKDIGRRAANTTETAQPLSVSDAEALTYASAGVSIDAGNSLVQRIKPLVKSTARPGADAMIGGFGGVVDLVAAQYTAPPLLVCAIDGVGTKLNIAHAMNMHDTVGIDCVAMNTNDLVVQGAEVLAFLDCYTCGVLDVNVAADFVKGVATGCIQSGCALVGGETAEMPGLFTGGDASKADGGVYDAVGAAIGAVKQGQRILPDKVSMHAGDVVLGLKSSGCHSNGFSLIRQIVAKAGLSMRDPAPWTDGKTSVGESLLTPTRIYVKSILAVIDLILGASHITGGGLLENGKTSYPTVLFLFIRSQPLLSIVPRMLPDHLAAEIDVSTYQMPRVFQWLKTQGRMEDLEFARTFNTGLGMVLVVKESDAVHAKKKLEEAGEDVFEVGKLIARIGEGCLLKGLESWA